MNKQEIFDIVSVHLIKQNMRSDSVVNGCLYRGPNGMKCAAGILIPDKFYDSSMEGTTISGLMEGGCKLPSFFQENIDFISDLQLIHDGSETDEWEAELRYLAEIHGLNTNAMDKAIKKRNAK